jgi:hypothetical protein
MSRTIFSKFGTTPSAIEGASRLISSIEYQAAPRTLSCPTLPSVTASRTTPSRTVCGGIATATEWKPLLA